MKIRTQRKGLREHWRKREASHEKRIDLTKKLCPSLNHKVTVGIDPAHSSNDESYEMTYDEKGELIKITRLK